MKEKFMWGASSSSFQSEGMWEKDGQGKSVISLMPNANIIFKNGVDFYHHYQEDISLMKKLGLTAFRFSISWTRIFPNGTGKINQNGVDFYHQVINTLKANNIEPIVTIYHFDYPLALVKKYKGWVSRQSIVDYVNYCNFLFEEFGAQVRYWITINEQDHVVKIPSRLGLKGDFNDNLKACYQANHNMSVANAEAIKLCHKLVKNSKIGPALSCQPYYPATNNKEDVEAANWVDLLTQRYILDLQCKGEYSDQFRRYLKVHNIELNYQKSDFKLIQDNQPDFIGINYYSSNIVKSLALEKHHKMISGYPVPQKEYGFYQIKHNPSLPITKWGWTIDPSGLKAILTSIYGQYHIPLLVTENGLGEEENSDQAIDDQRRINYLRDHITAMEEAKNNGVKVLGYCVWSFTDVVSGHNGLSKRYGLISVDSKYRRTPKQSYYFYQKLIDQKDGSC